MMWQNPSLVTAELARLEGQRIRVEIHRQLNRRSNNQNKYYWGIVIAYLCEYTGYEPDEMHDALRLKFLVEKSLIEGLPDRIKRTSKLNTKEMEEYLESVRRWAAVEFNLYIPEPNDT